MQIELTEPAGQKPPGHEARRAGKPVGCQKLERRQEGLEIEGILDGWKSFLLTKGGHPFGKTTFQDDNERVKTMLREERSLKAFAQTLELPSKSDLLQRKDSSVGTLGGQEHQVFNDVKNPERVIKMTHPGRFGRREHTPFLYLQRWAILKELAPETDPKLESIYEDNGELALAGSMTWIQGVFPTPSELEEYLESAGLVPLRDGSTTLDYIDPKSGIILRDCHPNNWIKISKEGEPIELFPINICPEAPEDWKLEKIAA